MVELDLVSGTITLVHIAPIYIEAVQLAPPSPITINLTNRRLIVCSKQGYIDKFQV